MSQLILFNKPFGVLSQFTDRGTQTTRPTLSAYIDLPDVYPAGRLDRDSEGLMILTDDGRLQARIAEPKHKLPKTYWVQVEGTPGPNDIAPLTTGIELRDGMTAPARCRLIDPPPSLWPRQPPIRVRQTVPDAWLELTLSEGRNRQVRRMCAAIGFPVLRLIRYRVGSWTIDGLASGERRTLVLDS